MKKLVHYLIIFLVIYWCFKNVEGCSVAKHTEVPQIESEEHYCEDCTEPMDEVSQEVSDSTNALISYEYLKDAIIKNQPHPKTFVELGKKIEFDELKVIVTIDYSVVNDQNNKVVRRCIGVHEFTLEGVLISVDIDDKIIP